MFQLVPMFMTFIDHSPYMHKQTNEALTAKPVDTVPHAVRGYGGWQRRTARYHEDAARGYCEPCMQSPCNVRTASAAEQSVTLFP